MIINPYIGHPSQLSGVEEHRLIGGKGDGMRLFEVRNGKGLEFTISADRCCDLSRMRLDGVNLGYFSPSGYVAPSFYDCNENGFLKSFTAGFMTTCGLTNVGIPCDDNGERTSLHGEIGNTPAEYVSFTEDDDCITFTAKVRQSSLFSHHLLLMRSYVCSKKENVLTLHDRITNIGADTEPLMLLYHFNIGYPLLSENSRVVIPNNGAVPRNQHAKTGLEKALTMEKPHAGYEEMCFFYDVVAKNGRAQVGIYNCDIDKGLEMNYDKNTLDCFTQWKMMGFGEYVLGLEPANCTPDGRAEMRKSGHLKELKTGESYETDIKLEFTDSENGFYEKFN